MEEELKLDLDFIGKQLEIEKSWFNDYQEPPKVNYSPKNDKSQYL